MREIKFRIWDLKNEYFFSSDTMEMLLDIEGASLWCQKIFYDDDAELLEIDDFEIMQYTGFKDNNGVEIYEGDIVKRTYLFDGAFGKTHVGEVVYDKEYARYVISKPNKYIEPRTEGLGDTLSYRSTYEVIGNIYNNPELLED